MASSDDIEVVRGQLEASEQALAAVQRNFDDFQDSSRELEEELEAELGRSQDQVSELTGRLAEAARRLGDQQAKSRALSGEVSVAQAETSRLKSAATRAATEKFGLEQSADELETRCRAAIAAEEDCRHKLDLAIEEKIFVTNDLEDLRAETLRTEEVLRSEMEDLRQELGRMGNLNSMRTPPEMVLPKNLSANGDYHPDANDGTPTVVDDASTANRAVADLGNAVEDGYPEAADELIKALEEEVDGLKTELEESEAANDELNLELQVLQEQLLESGGDEAGGDAGGVSAGEGKGADAGENGLPSGEIDGQVALKQDLADAMATCEELDQTVTDLTDELYSKDQQRSALEGRVTELEGELGSKTQSLEDQVSKAKSSASSLETKLADAMAELRAAIGSQEDASAKATAAKEQEELLLEEIASLQERVSELTTAHADLTNEVQDREAHLEEALSTVEELRRDQSRLQDTIETLSTRLTEEGAARQLDVETAAERESKLRLDLEVEKAATSEAVAAAEAAATEAAAVTSAGGEDGSAEEKKPHLADGGAQGGQGEGQSSGEMAARSAGSEFVVGDDSTGSAGPSVAMTTAAKAAALAAGQPSANERALEEEVARLTAALKKIREESAIGRIAATGRDAKGSSIAAALEGSDVNAVKTELRSVLDLYGKERSSNASLLSKIRALRGNIEVICRIRPPRPDETSSGGTIALEALGEGEVGVKTGKAGGSASWRSFTLDKALGPSTTQEEVFRQVEPLALSAADGMNACIFAYGQTGSGKTHTMIGDAKGGEMAGVSYRTMNKLFQVLELRRRQQPEYTFTVKVAMLEIYNEEVRDLLSSCEASSSAGGNAAGDAGAGGGAETGTSKLEIRRDQEGIVQVPGLTQVAVTSAEEVLALLEVGGGARAVAATGVHDHSSRSHSVLLAEVASRSGPDELPSTGRLFLVDLAGSERIKVSGVTGAGLREATSINSSLSALGDVMQALDQKQKHVPYRNSKLTFLLQDALGGNSRTAMVVTVCPTTLNVDETLFALQFATRARNVSLGPAHKNVGAKNLLEEGKELRARLREAGRKKEHAEEALLTLRREQARSQQKMGALLESRSKSVGDLRHQLEEQIDSLKSQLESSQANVLAERNKRAALEAESEDTQRQLKRSAAKVAALGRDREEREMKLRAKQEEVGELKAELRKTVSEAKTTVRRLSAGRSGTGGGAFGFKGKEGDAEGVAPGKGPPRTPSKNLSEAKTRYTRMRRSTPGRIPPDGNGSAGVSPYTSMSPPPVADSEEAMPTPNDDNNDAGTSARGVSIEHAAQGAQINGDLFAASGRGSESNNGVARETGGRASTTAVDARAALGAAPDGESSSRKRNSSDASAVTDAEGGAADDVAAAIARATAVFAKPAPRAVANGKDGASGSGSVSGGDGSTDGSKRESLARTKSTGVSSSLMRGTASSTSRLKLSAAALEDKANEMPAPRTGRLSVSSSTRPTPPSPPTSRMARPSSFTASSASRTCSQSGSGSKPKTPRVRNSLSGPIGRAAAAAAATAAASAAALTATSATSSRRSTLQPPSPAQTTSTRTGPASSRASISGHSGGKGWLGDKSRAGGSGRTSYSSRGSVSTGASAGGGTARAEEKAEAAGGAKLSRAQVALNRHQQRMHRIREKREERMGGQEGAS